MAREPSAKSYNVEDRVDAHNQRLGTSEFHIDGMADAASWDPNSVYHGWDPNSVPCCSQCNSRFASIATIFSDLTSQLNTRFNSIQTILNNIQDAGTA